MYNVTAYFYYQNRTLLKHPSQYGNEPLALSLDVNRKIKWYRPFLLYTKREMIRKPYKCFD